MVKITMTAKYYVNTEFVDFTISVVEKNTTNMVKTTESRTW